MSVATKKSVLRGLFPTPASKRWGMGVLTAVALHGAGAAFLWRAEPVVIPEPQSVLTVELAALTQAPQSNTESASPDEPDSTSDQQHQSETKPTPATQPSPKPISKTKVTADTQKTAKLTPDPIKAEPIKAKAKQPAAAETLPTPIEAKPAIQKPASTKAPAQAPTATPATSSPTRVQTSEPAGASVSKPASSSTKPAEATQPSSAQGKPAPSAKSAKAAQKATQNYYAMISAHLNRHKSYSAAAKKQQLSGVVTVLFTVEPSGVISASSIKTSSGHALLDEETLRLLTRVSPLPPMPPEMTQEAVSIALPINYQLERR